MEVAKKALMLARSDAVMQGIFDAVLRERDEFRKSIDELEAKAKEFAEANRKQQNERMVQVERRLEDLGVKIFRKDDHSVTINPDEGVVWMESRDECDCFMCKIGISKLFGGGR